MDKRTSLFLIAGEASGDLHTAHMVRELKKLRPHLDLCGFGGPEMKKAGVEVFFDMTTISALGLWEVLLKYFQFRRVFNRALEKVKEIKPAAVMLTDFPGFNLRFAKQIKKLGIPVIFYVSPQVWAWKKRRVHSIPKIVDKMLVILPFEKDLYEDPAMKVDFVGHPLTEHVRLSKSKEEIRKAFNIPSGKTLIALAPGSRKQELSRILPVMAETAALLKDRIPGSFFLIAKTTALDQTLYEAVLKKFDFPYRVIEGKTYECFHAADFSLIKSGTSTLEATILGAPYVLIYAASSITYWIGRLLVNIPFLGMANIIAGRKIVPEFIQSGARPRKIADFVVTILKDKTRLEKMREDLRKVKEAITVENPSGRAAKSVIDFLENK